MSKLIKELDMLINEMRHKVSKMNASKDNFFEVKSVINMLVYIKRLAEEETRGEALYKVRVPYTESMFYILVKNNHIGVTFGHDNAGKFTSEELEKYLPTVKQFAEKVKEEGE